MQHSNHRGMCKYKQKCQGTCHGCGRQALVPFLFLIKVRLIFFSLSVVFTNVCFSTLSQIVCSTNFANQPNLLYFLKCMHFFIELLNITKQRAFLTSQFLYFYNSFRRTNYALHVSYFYPDLSTFNVVQLCLVYIFSLAKCDDNIIAGVIGLSHNYCTVCESRLAQY